MNSTSSDSWPLSLGAHAHTLRTVASLALAAALVATVLAAVGWTRKPADREAPGIRIVDVRPLRSSDPALRDLISHTFAVRVAIHGWTLLPYQPGADKHDNRAHAGHWRLYLDGQPLADNLGTAKATYTYIGPGTHWIAAELSNADSTSLDPTIWSEPVILHVPLQIRCWQTGWHGGPATGTPTYTCKQRPRRST